MKLSKTKQNNRFKILHMYMLKMFVLSVLSTSCASPTESLDKDDQLDRGNMQRIKTRVENTYKSNKKINPRKGTSCDALVPYIDAHSFSVEEIESYAKSPDLNQGIKVTAGIGFSNHEGHCKVAKRPAECKHNYTMGLREGYYTGSDGVPYEVYLYVDKYIALEADFENSSCPLPSSGYSISGDLYVHSVDLLYEGNDLKSVSVILYLEVS